MTSKSIRQAQYNAGTIMFERQCHITSFRIGGFHFSSNPHRTKVYSFKTMTWKKGRYQGLATRVAMVIKGEVTLIQHTNKGK